MNVHPLWDRLPRETGGNSIYPFFWQQGEDHAILLRELEKIRQSGVGGFCVEARPHPDFGGPHWWRDMDMIMDYARTHDLQVWLLDDDRFPTGHANKAFSGGDHPLANRFLTVHSTDVMGPLTRGNMLVDALLPDDGALVGVVACPRVSGDTTELDLSRAVELTDRVVNGWLRWSVPAGLWRVLVFYTTCHGNGKLDYFNILDSRSVRLLLDRVYEPHYARYAADFGRTFRGFFSDEPEFANLPGYRFQARLGEDMPFIPWSEELRQRLERRWGDGFLRALPALWFPAGAQTGPLRYAYMDETTRQLEQSFSRQIGDWCRNHGVIHVGHIIEDDNSHGRLGCSTGHYFRSLSDMAMAGIDVVLLQVMPELDQRYHQWVASDRDGEFFHYGLGKLGSSLAHVDAKKQGNSMCEIFGAFGWQEGVGSMKWLADHMLSRGINHFVPHAFSPRPYPDADCPPHFYAHGNHAQYPYFCDLMGYLDRMSRLLRGGRYPAGIAVLYHADAEWAGEAMLFQEPVRALMERQLDCDVVPADLFDPEGPYAMTFDGQSIRVAEQAYRALVIPACQRIPQVVANFALQAQKTGFPVFWVGRLPEGLCEGGPVTDLDAEQVVSLDKLAERVVGSVPPLAETGRRWPRLRIWPYEREGMLLLLCFNESAFVPVEDVLTVHGGGRLTHGCRYDGFGDRLRTVDAVCQGQDLELPLALAPGESKLFILSAEALEAEPAPVYGAQRELAGPWEIWARGNGSATAEKVADCESERLPDLTDWAAAHKFNGTLLYRTTVEIEPDQGGVYGLTCPGQTDCGAVLVDGVLAGRFLGVSDPVELSLPAGRHSLELQLPVTPVWEAGDPWSALTMLPPPGLTEKPVLRRREA